MASILSLVISPCHLHNSAYALYDIFRATHQHDPTYKTIFLFRSSEPLNCPKRFPSPTLSAAVQGGGAELLFAIYNEFGCDFSTQQQKSSVIHQINKLSSSSSPHSKLEGTKHPPLYFGGDKRGKSQSCQVFGSIIVLSQSCIIVLSQSCQMFL